MLQALVESSGTDDELTRDEILLRVQEVLRSEFETEPGRALLAARLEEDLDLDSIDLVALATRLEQETGFLLKEERLRGLSTVQDVVDFVFELQLPGAAIGRPE